LSKASDTEQAESTPEELKAKIQAIRDEKEAALNPSDNAGRGVAGRMITDFASAVVVGSGIGWWLDKQFDTSPLWLMILLVFGMMGGFLNMMRTFNRSSSEKK